MSDTPEIWFYHLKTAPLERVLVQLLEKTLANGWRALVVAPDRPRLEALDGYLWTYRDESFLPHAVSPLPSAAQQPVLLSTDQDNVNQADLLILVDGATPEVWEGFRRIILVFADQDAGHVEVARSLWTEAKSKDLTKLTSILKFLGLIFSRMN